LWGLLPLWVSPFLGRLLLGLAAIVATVIVLRAALQASAAPRDAQLLASLAALSALLPLYRYTAAGWDTWLHWRNLPILLLPSALLLLRLRTPRLRAVVGAALLVLVAGYAAGMLYVALSVDYARDFHALYHGVAQARQGADALYDIVALTANPLTDTYKYPPTFQLLIAPLSGLNFTAAFTLWRWMNLMLLVLTLGWLLRGFQIPLRSWAGAALLVLTLSLEAVFDTVRFGQLDIVILALAAAALLAVRTERDGVSGAWIGIAASIKVYPLLLVVPALARRRWRTFIGMLAASTVVAVLSIALFGWHVHRQFIVEVLPRTGVTTGWVENQTFNGWLNRILHPEQISLAPDDGSLRWATYLWAGAVMLLTMWFSRPAAGLSASSSFGLGCVGLLLALPTVWTHYQVLLLLSFWLLIVVAREEPQRVSWSVIACAGLAWMLIAFGNIWTFFDRTLYGPFWLLLLSYKFYGTLLLFIAYGLMGMVAPRGSPVGYGSGEDLVEKRGVSTDVSVALPLAEKVR
jgi:hypothetical protein